MTVEVVEQREIGTVTITVVKCFGGEVYSVAITDSFGVAGCRRVLGPLPPSAEQVETFVAQHVAFSQCRTRRN